MNFKTFIGLLVFSSPLWADRVQDLPMVQNQNENMIGERSPGFSKLELQIERLPSGKIQATQVDPDGPFNGIVKEGEVFNSFEDIPRPLESH
jgi:hypothetical protein